MRFSLKKISVILVFVYVFISLMPIQAKGNQVDDSLKLLSTNKHIYSYQNDGNIDTSKLIVKYNEGIGDKEKQDVHNIIDIENIEVVEDLNMEILQLEEDEDIYNALNKLNSNINIKYAEPSYDRKHIPDGSDKYSTYSTVYDPNDFYYKYQWGMQVTEMVYAWQKVSMNDRQKITVAVVDTGVDYTHSELSDFVLKDDGYDFVNNDSDAYDDNKHGTAAAGVIGAKTNNSKGIAGVASGVNILPVKVLDSQGDGNSYTVMMGLKYAVDHGAQIINLSLGGDNYSNAEAEVIEYAFERGVVVVAASGNDGGLTAKFPASYPGVISVGAIDGYGDISSFSNIDSQVVAPGELILSTIRGDGNYDLLDGTSFAAPFVAGLAALIVASSKDFMTGLALSDTNSYSRIYQVGVAIENGCVDLGNIGFDSIYGSGMVNGKNTFENMRYFVTDISDAGNDIGNITVKAYDYTNTFKSSVSDSVYIYIKDSQDNICTSKEVKLTGGIGVGAFKLDIGIYTAIIDSKNANSRTIDFGADFLVSPDKPVANYNSGTYTNSINVQLSTTTEGAQILYSINGEYPMNYNGSITISSSSTLEAIAVKNGIRSKLSTYKYVIKAAPTPTTKKSSGGGGGGGGGGGFAFQNKEATTTPEPTQTYKAFEGKTFSDIVKHWAKNDIEIMAEKGVVKGISEDMFAPDDKITRAQFASFLVRSLGLEDVKAESNFKDVLPGTWYYESVNKAFKIGIVSGVSDTQFKPDMAITREQMALMIMKAYIYITKITEVEMINLNELGYKDVDKISSWAKDSVAFSGRYELMFGDENKYYKPKENATRAQAVAVIRRLLDKTGEL